MTPLNISSLKKIWSQDTWVKPFLGQYKKALAYSLALGVLTVVFAAGLMFTSGFLISDAAEQPALGLYSLFVPLGLVQVFGVGKPFLGYFERLVSHDWVLRITSSMRLKLYNSIEADGVFWTASHRVGDALGLLAEDIGHVQNLYLRTVFPLIIAWILWALLIIMLGFFSPVFALFMLLSLGVMVFLLPVVSALINSARQLRIKNLTHTLYVNAYDDVAGLADWIFSQRRHDYLERITSVDEDLSKASASSAKTNRTINLFGQIVFGITILTLLVWASFHFGSIPQETAGTGFDGRPADWIAAFVLGLFPLSEAFSPLPDATTSAVSHLDSLERLNNLDEKPASSIKYDLSSLSKHPTVSLESVSFSYEDDKKLLNNINISIPPGQKVALLGPSGSGKSTLLSLIRGEHTPTTGTVLIDGVPTAHLGDDICSYISLVQQNTYIFNKTLLWNLSLGNTSVTEENALNALDAVGLTPLVKRLPKGLHTLVDEEGLMFSGGERHRIALARVLLKDTPIVLLDEPTVSLDPITEQQLLTTLFQVLEGRTIIMVTHHLAGVQYTDKVIFLENGSIALEGAHQELAESNQRYQQLLSFDQGVQ